MKERKKKRKLNSNVKNQKGHHKSQKTHSFTQSKTKNSQLKQTLLLCRIPTKRNQQRSKNNSDTDTAPVTPIVAIPAPIYLAEVTKLE